MLFFILWTRFSFDQILGHAFFFRLSIQLRSSCIGTYLWLNWIEASIAQEKNISSYTTSSTTWEKIFESRSIQFRRILINVLEEFFLQN